MKAATADGFRLKFRKFYKSDTWIAPLDEDEDFRRVLVKWWPKSKDDDATWSIKLEDGAHDDPALYWGGYASREQAFAAAHLIVLAYLGRDSGISWSEETLAARQIAAAHAWQARAHNVVPFMRLAEVRRRFRRAAS